MVFSFGSNSVKQLRGRVGNPDILSKEARAKGWQRIFAGAHKNWNFGGVASMHPCEGDCVTYGAVVWLNDEELARLDVFEGTPTVYQQ